MIQIKQRILRFSVLLSIWSRRHKAAHRCNSMLPLHPSPFVNMRVQPDCPDRHASRKLYHWNMAYFDGSNTVKKRKSRLNGGQLRRCPARSGNPPGGPGSACVEYTKGQGRMQQRIFWDIYILKSKITGFSQFVDIACGKLHNILEC